MFGDLKKKFVIEEGFCIATEVVEHDEKKKEGDRQYRRFTLAGEKEELIKYRGKYYRHRRILDNFEIKPLGLTSQDIVRKCQGPIPVSKRPIS